MAALSEKSNVMDFKSLKPFDVFCYICRGVLIKPVTLPCKHVFCLNCFESSMLETSYSCPLCRRRISNWVRSAKKSDSLLNTDLWEKIKVQFKNEVASKLSGEDDGLDDRIQELFENRPVISSAGEVGEEYLNQKNEFEKHLRLQREKEERESLALIAQMQKEDLEREKKLAEEEKMNETFLRLETSAGNSSISAPSSSKNNSMACSSSSKKQVFGPMDHHIKRLSQVESSNKQLRTWGNHLANKRSESSDSGDSIGFELNHFKPIRIVPKTPPKEGTLRDLTVKKITPLKLFTERTPIPVGNKLIDGMSSIHSNFSAFRERITHPTDVDEGCETPKKKAKLLNNESFEIGVLKEINLDENSDSNSVGKWEMDAKSQEDLRISKLGSSLMGEENFSGIEELFDREEQKRIEERLLQEKADRELALKLSREWGQTYEPRVTRLSRTCRSGARQTTLLNKVVRRQKK